MVLGSVVRRAMFQQAMERWRGRVAMVTGASAGIGAAVAKALVNEGMTVVGLARRDERIKEMAKNLEAAPGKLHAVKCNLRDEEDILSAFKWVKENVQGVEVLINNAGVLGETALTEAETEEWRRQLDVNVLALSICTREAVKSMRERSVDDGHIIHINSIAGHNPPFLPQIAMYTATKHAVTALTEGLRKDLVASNSRTRVTSISPGLVNTEIFDNLKTFSRANVLTTGPHLLPEDIADAVLYALAAPPHVQIHELTIKPVGEAA
ncbi:farnesol dehydrogenase [Anabrus simplex]|uniref:farnesol dehydrogenase n=1 Tax=Anabrus simplex TaxID=316456 RepID=UPI0034DD2326